MLERVFVLLVDTAFGNGDRSRVPAHGGSSTDSVSAIDPSKIT